MLNMPPCHTSVPSSPLCLLTPQKHQSKVAAAKAGLQAQLATQAAQKEAAVVPEWRRRMNETKIAREDPALAVALASQKAAEMAREGKGREPPSVGLKPSEIRKKK